MPPRKRRIRGHIEQLPSGSHRAIVYAGTDPLTGRARQVRETWPTYDEAEKVLTRLQRQVDEEPAALEARAAERAASAPQEDTPD